MTRDVCEHFTPIDLPCAKCEKPPTLRTAAQQALAAMENIDKEFRRYGRQHWPEAVKARSALTAIRAALAEPVQEPVAWMDIDSDGQRLAVRQWSDGNRDEVPLYTAPPHRKPLTDEEISNLWSWSMTVEAERTATTQQHAFARAIERAHGIGGRDE